MQETIIAEVTRGALVESRHAGAVAVFDADGGCVLALGDIARPVFPRSAVKAFQALPLLESGAADAFGLTEAELALACASHSGEPEHAALAARMLDKAGRDAGCLECGAHPPMGRAAADDLVRQGLKPGALHNNCSGKHAGFICLSCQMGEDTRGYVKPDHAVQREVRAALESMTGTPHTPDNRGTDGCAIPTYAVPLAALAQAFARFGTGRGLGSARASAAARLRRAVAAHPFMVAGTERFDTLAMQALGERAFIKTGAEGVYCAALPELGLGVALKCADGATRAAEAAMAGLLLRYLDMPDDVREQIAALASPVLRNWNGEEVGRVRPASAITARRA